VAFYGELLTKIDAELLRRADGGFVESYTQGGDTIQTMPTEKLEGMRDRYAAKAASESGGSRIILADLRGRR
jgi:hypothetical protein